MKYIILALTIAISFSSCSKEISVEEQFNIDQGLIEEYIKANNLTTQVTSEGIHYILENEGSAEKPKITSKLTVTYKGYFLDGKVFDSAEKASIDLFNTIVGWQKGMPKFGRLGKGKLIIPSKFAYGTSDRPGRANAILVFDVEMFDF